MVQRVGMAAGDTINVREHVPAAVRPRSAIGLVGSRLDLQLPPYTVPAIINEMVSTSRL